MPKRDEVFLFQHDRVDRHTRAATNRPFLHDNRRKKDMDTPRTTTYRPHPHSASYKTWNKTSHEKE